MQKVLLNSFHSCTGHLDSAQRSLALSALCRASPSAAVGQALWQEAGKLKQTFQQDTEYRNMRQQLQALALQTAELERSLCEKATLLRHTAHAVLEKGYSEKWHGHDDMETEVALGVDTASCAQAAQIKQMFATDLHAVTAQLDSDFAALRACGLGAGAQQCNRKSLVPDQTDA